MSYGRTFALWRAAAPDWDAYTRHGFVQALGDGSLPRAAFLTYLVQDYLFLIQFSRAWALAVVKAGDLQEMRACSATVHALLDQEMALHVQTAPRPGSTRPRCWPRPRPWATWPIPATCSRRAIPAISWTCWRRCCPACWAMAKSAPGWAAKGRPIPPYRDWIDTYAGDDYQQTCRAAGALLDDAVRKRLGDAPQSSPRWAGLVHHFATATRLEVGFWDLGTA